jgi:hypothetical protein
VVVVVVVVVMMMIGNLQKFAASSILKPTLLFFRDLWRVRKAETFEQLIATM